MQGANCSSLHGSDYQDKISQHQLKQNSTVLNHTKPFSKRNSFSDLYEDSPRENFAYNSKKKQRMSGICGAEGMGIDSVANGHGHYDGKIGSKLHDYDDVSPNVIERSENLELKPSVLIRNLCESADKEEKGLSMRMKKVNF